MKREAADGDGTKAGMRRQLDCSALQICNASSTILLSSWRPNMGVASRFHLEERLRDCSALQCTASSTPFPPSIAPAKLSPAPLLPLLFSSTSAIISRAQLTPSFPRRRHAHNHKPNTLARDRRSNRPPTRLVPRPRHRLLLHEYGLRHRWARSRTTQHVLPHGARLPDRRPIKESLSRNILSSTGAAAEWSTEAEYRRQCDDSGSGDGCTWSCVVFCKLSFSPFQKSKADEPKSA